MAPFLPDTPDYSEFDTGDTSFPVSRHVNSVGFAFCNGLVVGSMYHFIKGLRNNNAYTIPSKLVAGVNAARINARRTAGFFGLFSMVIDASYYATFKLQGGEDDVDVKGDMLVGATTGAIMWAPRGLRSASRASLVFGAIPLAYAALSNTLVRYDEYLRAESPNPYSYSHYHLNRNPETNTID